jgi:carbon-monoxide dehydrogenase medium subunit
VIPSQFDYYCPSTLPEALALLTKYQDDAKVLAGGQSLISLLKLRLANPKCVVDIGQIPGLSYIREQGDTVVIGAMTTYNEMRDSKLLQEKAPLLPKAAAVVGDVQVRNRGTLGGCVAHADPAGDVPAAVLALNADVRILGPKGERWVKITDFFLGLYATALEPSEILTEVRVPILKGWKFAYLKAARRPSDFAIVGVAAALRTKPDGTCEEVGIAVTGVTDKPYRADAVEAKLKGKKLDPASIAAAAPAMIEGVDLSSTIHASAEFRGHLAQVYLRRAIEAAA